MNALIVDRGSTRYGVREMETLHAFLKQVALVTDNRCACCNKRVCWNRIGTLERARQFAVTHIPHKDEPTHILMAWAKLVSLLV